MTGTAIEPVEGVESTEVQRAVNGYQLVAIDQAGLSTAHGQMVEWTREQQHLCDMEKAEETENLNVAVRQKWATAPFRKRIAMLDRRIAFYQKIRTALELGFVIVPNFQMDVFAIRTKAATPRNQADQREGWGGNRTFTEPVPILPAGEGEYQNPTVPADHLKDHEPDGKGGTRVTHYYSTPDEFADLSFPIALAKPVLMTQTAQAMAARVFDEVGVAVDTAGWRGNRRGDPIILGRIRNPRKRADITFFIGWYFDPSRI